MTTKAFSGRYVRDNDGRLQPLYTKTYDVIPTWCGPLVPCFAHRRVDGKAGWQVTHFTTGLRISSGRTRREAINSASRKIHMYGEDAVYMEKEDA